MGKVKMREAPRFEGRVTSATVSRTADRWYVAIGVEVDYGPLLDQHDLEPQAFARATKPQGAFVFGGRLADLESAAPAAVALPGLGVNPDGRNVQASGFGSAGARPWRIHRRIVQVLTPRSCAACEGRY